MLPRGGAGTTRGDRLDVPLQPHALGRGAKDYRSLRLEGARMTDLTTFAISAAYGALAILSGALMVISLRARRPGVPGHRALLLAAGMALLLVQGLLLLAVVIEGGLVEEDFLLYASVLEVTGVALFLAATVR